MLVNMTELCWLSHSYVPLFSSVERLKGGMYLSVSVCKTLAITLVKDSTNYSEDHTMHINSVTTKKHLTLLE